MEGFELESSVLEVEVMVSAPEASFLKERLRLRGKLAPTQQWHSAQLAPTQKLAPMLVLKNWPQGQ
jgi:hypothetical protein